MWAAGDDVDGVAIAGRGHGRGNGLVRHVVVTQAIRVGIDTVTVHIEGGGSGRWVSRDQAYGQAAERQPAYQGRGDATHNRRDGYRIG